MLTGPTEFFWKPPKTVRCVGAKASCMGLPCSPLVLYPLGDSRNFKNQPFLRANDVTLQECRAGCCPDPQTQQSPCPFAEGGLGEAEASAKNVVLLFLPPSCSVFLEIL